MVAAADSGTDADAGSVWGASSWPNLAVADAWPRRTEVARADWALGWTATTPTEATIAREPAATAREGRGTGSRRQATGDVKKIKWVVLQSRADPVAEVRARRDAA